MTKHDMPVEWAPWAGRARPIAIDSPRTVLYAPRTERCEPYGFASAPAAEAGGPAGTGWQRNSEDIP